MIDVVRQVNAAQRRVGGRTLQAGQARAVTIARIYETSVADLWDACTNPERIPRWFLPISGELRLGGRYQLEGNAGGTIESCDPPHGFSATWEYGASTGWIEVRFSARGDAHTLFELEHITPINDGGHWDRFGPGATGVGWDLALIGLTLYLTSGSEVDPREIAAWSASEDGRRFISSSARSWCEADVAGGADPPAAQEAADRTAAFYTDPRFGAIDGSTTEDRQ
jgi:uncharacterized protein YndB with AHSA1/START domain